MAPQTYINVLATTSPNIGGQLIVNTATITAVSPNCPNVSNPLWGGIEAYCTGGVNQGSNATTSSQAAVFMNPGSCVSYADVGVQLGYWSGSTDIGGSIIQAKGALFYNNSCSIYFDNFQNRIGTTELPNLSYFSQCSFINDDNSISADPRIGSFGIVDVYGHGVNNINFIGCTFSNSTSITPATGIEASDMGLTVRDYCPVCTVSSVGTRSTFSNFSMGIDHYTTSMPNHTINVRNSEFNNNVIGIESHASIVPSVVNNIFNIPTLHTGIGWLATPIQSIGLLLLDANAYNVNSNSFIGSYHYGFAGNKSVGVVASNTGGTDNLINNNTYFDLGSANLAEYVNYSSTYGLNYMCNSYSTNNFDEAVLGNGVKVGGNLVDGIRSVQGFTTTGTFAGRPVTYPIPAGNIFSNGFVTLNLYNVGTMSNGFTYAYNQTTPFTPTEALEQPGNPPITGRDADISVTTVGLKYYSDRCNIGLIALTPPTFSGYEYLPILDSTNDGDFIDSNSNLVEYNYLATINNINYYMCDSSGMQHRDSLYYWLAQLQSPYGDLTIANMLLQDGSIDSATAMFDSIPTRYNLDSFEAAEFTGPGTQIFNVWSAMNAQSSSTGIVGGTMVGLSFVNSDSSAFTFDSTTEANVISAFNSGNMWARIVAENILKQYDSATFNSLYAAMPDTLLYPTPQPYQNAVVSPPGVLTIQQIATGPSVYCQYAVMVASNCGSNDSATVDVRGWIVDDNNGVFDTAGCDVGYGITHSHYMFAYDSVWQNVPIGSLIVLYNADSNCYGFVDSFSIDTVFNPADGSILRASSTLFQLVATS